MIGSVKKAILTKWGESVNPPPWVVRHNFADLGFPWEIHDI
jgi:hypothetical protein